MNASVPISAARLAKIHTTTTRFIFELGNTEALIFVRQTPETGSDALDAESVLDLIADIDEYNDEPTTPARIVYKLETSVVRHADSARMPTRSAVFCFGAINVDPELTKEQVKRLVQLFYGYADPDQFHHFISQLGEPALKTNI